MNPQRNQTNLFKRLAGENVALVPVYRFYVLLFANGQPGEIQISIEAWMNRVT
jgi:hypothetical protein